MNSSSRSLCRTLLQPIWKCPVIRFALPVRNTERWIWSLAIWNKLRETCWDVEVLVYRWILSDIFGWISAVRCIFDQELGTCCWTLVRKTLITLTSLSRGWLDWWQRDGVGRDWGYVWTCEGSKDRRMFIHAWNECDVSYCFNGNNHEIPEAVFWFPVLFLIEGQTESLLFDRSE